MKDIKIETQYQPIIITVRQDSAHDEAIIDEIFKDNVYRLHDNFFAEEGVVLDVGANIGVFTLNVLLRAKNNGKPITVFAIEPEPHNLELLQRNLDQNAWLQGDSSVVVVASAISDKHGRSYISNDHGGSRIGERSEGDTLISTITFDDFIEIYNIDKVSFAKFDIEGAEVPAILAASIKNVDKIRRTAIEFDEENGLDRFADLINIFARNCQINTLGVPARGCYIYTERFDV